MLKPTTELYKHQIASVLQFHIQAQKTADWSDCGVGKSLIALSKFDALRDAGVAKCLLVVCPLSVMSSWRDEVDLHTNFRVTTLSGPMEKRIELLKSDSEVFLITYDAIASRGSGKLYMFAALLEKFSGNNMIICDEATMIKSIEAKRTQALIALCDAITHSMFLSGTFIPQDLQDIFTIYRAMDGGLTFGENIYAARNIYMQNVGDMYPKWELRPEKRDEFILKLYSHGIRLRKEDCIDLPPKVTEIRKCYLTPEQAVYYNKMRKNLCVELDDVSISVKGILSKLSKLQQIIGGFIYDSAGASHYIPSSKYNLLTEILEQVGDDKVVIYARYRQEITKIQAHLAALGFDSVPLHGGLNDKARSSNIHYFRTDPKIKALVAQVSTGGYGLTVVEANHVIYFSMTFSLIDFKQSQDRIHRIGQTKTCVYHYLLTEDEFKTPIDQYIYNSLVKNNDLANSLANFNEFKKLKEQVLSDS